MKRIKPIVARVGGFLRNVERLAWRLANQSQGVPIGSRNHGMLYLNGAMLTDLVDFTYSLADGEPAQIQGSLLCCADSGEFQRVLRMSLEKEQAFMDLSMAESGDRFQTRGRFTHASISTGVGQDTKLHFRFECKPRCFS